MTTQEIPEPTAEQLKKHFLSCAIPMIGFGFMDQTVMVHAGNMIDLSFGVYFGLSTLSAAACGQICSDVAGVTFGGAIERFATWCGLPESKLSGRQQSLRRVKQIGFFGRIAGVVLGCVLGLTNLLFIDASRTQQLKLDARNEGGEHSVIVSNRDRKDATTVTVVGPDTDGLVASIATTLAQAGFSLVEVRGGPVPVDEDNKEHRISDVFTIRKDGDIVDDGDLDSLARLVVDACRQPKQAVLLEAENSRLQAENQLLKDKLDALLHERRVKIARRNTDHVYHLPPSIAVVADSSDDHPDRS